MQPQQDFVILFEGRVKENRAKIVDFMDKDIKWKYRELTLISDKAATNEVLRQGSVKKKDVFSGGVPLPHMGNKFTFAGKGRSPK